VYFVILHIQESGSERIVLKAMGRAINKAVTIAEILKRKLPLHQVNSLTSVEMVDVYEPLEEGLDTVTSRRYVSCMIITLSLSARDLDTNDPGYQPPLAEDEMHNSVGPAAEITSSHMIPSA
jgi:ribonuclease P/MRP protein subunit RPP25